MEIKDKGTCPYCEKEFEVENYGFKVDCPGCKRKIDVFPDPTWIETKWGMVGISSRSLLGLINGGKP